MVGEISTQPHPLTTAVVVAVGAVLFSYATSLSVAVRREKILELTGSKLPNLSLNLSNIGLYPPLEASSLLS